MIGESGGKRRTGISRRIFFYGGLILVLAVFVFPFF